MKLSAGPVNGGVPGKKLVALRRACVVVAACWALAGAGLGVWVFRFWWTQPVPVFDPATVVPAYSMLDALIQAFVMAALLAALSAALVACGINYLRAARTGGPWPVAWTCSVAAAGAAEMAFIAVFLDPPVPLVGQEVLGHPSWGMLAFPAAFVLIGAAMIAVIAAEARQARRAAGVSPQLVPGTRQPDRQPGPAGPARAAFWVSACVPALLGSIGWSFAADNAQVGCVDPSSCASSPHWVLAGAAVQWALVIAVAVLVVLGWLRPLRRRAVTVLAAVATPLAIIWYVVTTAAAASG